MNFPDKMHDTSAGISKEEKHLNAVNLVKSINTIFNKKETAADREQKNMVATESDKQFIDDTGATPARKTTNRRKNK